MVGLAIKRWKSPLKRLKGWKGLLSVVVNEVVVVIQ